MDQEVGVDLEGVAKESAYYENKVSILKELKNNV